MSDKNNNPFNLPPLQMPDNTRLAENLGRILEQSRRLLDEYARNQGNSFSIPDPGVVSKSFMELGQFWLRNPTPLLQAQMRFTQEYFKLWQNYSQRLLGQEASPVVQPDKGDKRFKDDDWAENVLFDFVKQSYLLAARALREAVSDLQGLDPKTAEKVDFYTRQYIDALSPTNFALTNPKVVKATLESGGENLLKGLQQLLTDLERGKGQLRISMTDLEAFELGKNVATTPGKVVFQNALMQLVQYNPSTEQVSKRPLLIIPPWINKFYILDLRPKNSFIKWAVDQGFTVFIISWVNPDERLADKNFEHYISEGTLAALDAIEKATGVNEINAAAYCIGGTLLASTLAYMAAKGDERIKSATFFTTMLDFSDPGELGVFIDEEQIGLIEKRMQERGYLEGSEMSSVFNLLRANDLIWSFVVNNYLLGKEPMAFDLLYWNSDSTRMPRAMHSFYLRNMYLDNKLKDPGGVTLLGQPIDLRAIQTPAYFISTREDHIAPWTSTYMGARLFGGPVKFVLGGSGHIAGVINPADSNKYGYWTNSKLPETSDEWLSGAKANDGSWWPDWFKWVKRYAGADLPARTPGDGQLPVLEDAPGSYVKARI